MMFYFYYFYIHVTTSTMDEIYHKSMSHIFNINDKIKKNYIRAVGFKVKGITEPLIRERADKVYLVIHWRDDKAVSYLEKVLKILQKEKYLKVEKIAMNIWNLFECLETYKKIINDEEYEGGKNTHVFVFVNVSTGVKYRLLLELWLV